MRLLLGSSLVLLSLCSRLPAAQTAAAPASFDQSVTAVLKQNCVFCHNGKMASGNLNLEGFTAPASVGTQREAWEKIATKVRSGEMPPKSAPPLADEKRQAFLRTLMDAFETADKSRPPDPGRILARRLNRAEYANTVRDVLGVRFKAGEEFPADDSVLGFDNIGEVLTVSPLLMDKYVHAAETIASLAIGGDPLPKPLFTEYKPEKVRRIDIGGTEITDYVDYAAEYVFRVWVRGHLGPQGAPVPMNIMVDGKVVKAVEVPTKENETTTVARDAQRSNHEVRLFLPAGEHTFRAELIGDDFRKPIPPPPVRRNGFLPPPSGVFPEKFDLQGPFPAKDQVAARSKLLTCDPATGSDCIRRIVTPIARRAYRRPVTSAEIDRLMAVAQLASTKGFTPAQCVQFAIQAILVSPNFLFRIEQDPKGRFAPVSDLELASRLSYFLWSSAPDDELLTLAEQKRLRKPGVLEQQVTRMLGDKRSRALSENFAGQWLETRSLAGVKPDALKFPTWSPALQEDMQTETALFFDHILRENRPIAEFITADYAFLNGRLAQHYGIVGITGSDFRKVQVDPAQRGGILTQGSILTLTSYPIRTSPVLRGKYILDVVLGAPPPAPPPDVPGLNESKVGTAASLREALARHRSDAICASCHSRMDPLGFGLENYDATGRWRVKDGETAIQAGGKLPNGVEFSTPAELKALLLKDLPAFNRNLTEKMLTYALGRGLESYDRPVVRDIVRKVEASGGQMQAVVREIVQSLPFQARRGQQNQPVKVASTR